MAGPVSVLDSKFDLRLLYQCGSTSNCLRRSVPGKHIACVGDVKKKSFLFEETDQQKEARKG